VLNSLLEKARPGLYSGWPGKILSTQGKLDMAQLYIEEFYPQFRRVRIFGVSSRGDQSLFSDSYLLVNLLSFAPAHGHEMLREIRNDARGEVLQFTDPVSASAVLKQKITEIEVINNAITEGIIVAGATSMGYKLRATAKLTFQDALNVVDIKVLDSLRILIANQLFKAFYPKEVSTAYLTLQSFSMHFALQSLNWKGAVLVPLSVCQNAYATMIRSSHGKFNRPV
jgi:hypothetical protein